MYRGEIEVEALILATLLLFLTVFSGKGSMAGRGILVFKNKYLKQHTKWNHTGKTGIFKIFITDLS